MLIAATDRGICSIQFARSDGELIDGLKREFPFAARKVDVGGLRSWVEALLQHMRGKDLDSSLPLDIRATAFQRRVWTYLQSIPFGDTRSYQPGGQGDRPAQRDPRRGPCLRHQPGRGRDPVPSRGPRATAAWEAIAGASSGRRPCSRWSSSPSSSPRRFRTNHKCVPQMRTANACRKMRAANACATVEERPFRAA